MNLYLSLCTEFLLEEIVYVDSVQYTQSLFLILGSESPKYPADEDSSERTTYIPEQYWIDAW